MADAHPDPETASAQMSPARRIALVTGATMAKPDSETHLLVAALSRAGMQADVLPWDAPVDWASYALVVVRTPWDYFSRLDEFLAWVTRTGELVTVLNPPALIRWNSHKRYLAELAAQGVPTVPTLWIERGAADGPQRLRTRGWDEVVVKPAVSIGAIGALRAHATDPACAAHLAALAATGDVMVQPYLPSVAEEGEVSLIHFGGVFSHAIRKRPAAGDFRVQDMYGGSVHPHRPDLAEEVLAARLLACLPSATAYARIDIVRVDGAPALMEIELIEPELFLGADAGAAVRFAEQLMRHVI